MEIRTIKDDPTDRIIEVNFTLSETDMFIAWFSHLKANKIGVKVNGNLYRFRTEQEKACFTYGLGHFYRETDFQTSRIEKLKTQIKESNNKINGFFENIKSYALDQLLN